MDEEPSTSSKDLFIFNSGPEYCKFNNESFYIASRVGKQSFFFFFIFLEPLKNGSIKLNISNISTLRRKITTSFHTISNLPWLVF